MRVVAKPATVASVAGRWRWRVELMSGRGLHHRLIAAVGLGLIQRLVGPAQQYVERLFVGPACRDTSRESYRRSDLWQRRCRQAVAQRLHALRGVLRIGVGQQLSEFFAAEPTAPVFRC